MHLLQIDIGPAHRLSPVAPVSIFKKEYMYICLFVSYRYPNGCSDLPEISGCSDRILGFLIIFVDAYLLDRSS